jgi:hypothetical protein
MEKRREPDPMLEGVLAQAVRNGASEVAAKLRKLEPAGMMMQFYLGTPRAGSSWKCGVFLISKSRR